MLPYILGTKQNKSKKLIDNIVLYDFFIQIRLWQMQPISTITKPGLSSTCCGRISNIGCVKTLNITIINGLLYLSNYEPLLDVIWMCVYGHSKEEELSLKIEIMVSINENLPIIGWAFIVWLQILIV